MRKITLVLLILTCISMAKIKAQSNAVRVNIPSLMLGNINADVSFMLSDRFSLHLQGQVKPIDFKIPAPIHTIHINKIKFEKSRLFQFGLVDHSLNLTVQPGIRFWINGVYNRGFFFGANALASVYKMGGDKVDPFYMKGYSLGGAISSGYSYEISTFWNIEAELGIGVFYNKYHNLLGDSKNVSFFNGDVTDVTIFPSRASLSLVYLF